jgi:hyperosmotically inducible periplasmic protein
MTHPITNETMKQLFNRVSPTGAMNAGFAALPWMLTRRFAGNGAQSRRSSAIPSAGAIALGAAAMYWLDPVSGRRRRALALDQMQKAWTYGRELADKKSRHLRNRAQGMLSETAALFHGDRPTDDVLQARVRAELGLVCSQPSMIGVRATDGRVELAGSIDRSEHDRAIAAIRRVRGVRDVVDRFETS